MLMDRDPMDRSGLDRAGSTAPSLAGYGDVDVSGYGHLRLGLLLSGYADTETSGYGLMRNEHDLSGYADTETDATGQIRIYHEVSFTFTGTLAPGKTIVINGEDYTVVNDGVNAIAGFSGEFPRVFGGVNTLTYTDAEGARNATILVVKQDRRA